MSPATISTTILSVVDGKFDEQKGGRKARQRDEPGAGHRGLAFAGTQQTRVGNETNIGVKSCNISIKCSVL